MTQEQRRELIRTQLVETPEVSDRQIAAGLGIDHKTVGAQRADLVERGEIPHVEKAVDTLGREQPRQRKPVSVFNPTVQQFGAHFQVTNERIALSFSYRSDQELLLCHLMKRPSLQAEKQSRVSYHASGSSLF